MNPLARHYPILCSPACADDTYPLKYRTRPHAQWRAEQW
jgi:hypothetical protein